MMWLLFRYQIKSDFMFKHILLAGACLALSAVGAGAAEAPAARSAQLPVKAFFTPPQFSGAMLSPDGKNLALLLRGPEGHIVLANMPAAGGAVRILAGVREMDVFDIHWVNNRRLVFSAHRTDADENERARGPGLHAIDIDGSKYVHLVAHEWRTSTQRTTLPPNTFFLSTVRDDQSSDVYVTRQNIFNEDFQGYALFRLNTETGNLVRVDAPEGVSRVLIDAGGTPRVATRRQDGVTQLLYKDPSTAKWRELGAYALQSPENVSPAIVTRSGQLYVSSYHGRNTAGLYRMDVNTGKLDPEPIVGLKHFDFSGSLILAPDRESLLGVRYETSEPITTWVDEGMKQVQQRIDALLPSTINELHLASDAVSDAIVVRSYSDTEPGSWQLYHRSTGKLTPLGTSMPGINPLQMADISFVRVTARDGREIPAYLTLPKGERKNLPMVVLVHGGPWVRGVHFGWDPQVQFLASRGYAVLQPEFRGSRGFGKEYFMAGWKQWGQAMQDDVADATRWAIDKGFADGKRVCIAGASYGGYSTLMGLIRNPELFRCGVDWVGVTDINLLYDLRFTNTSQDAKTYGLPALIGDQKEDAAMLKANSPLENASKITQPLLLAYGGKDRTVPIEHGKKFYEAVKRTNPHVEWIEYPDEGHGWRYERTRLDFWSRVERFLGENLGKP
jgi:dipeptidyl aminopeptidase/acylaminoacyl peptidase